MHRPSSSVYRVQVLDRALNVLNALAARSGECSLAELAGDVRLHKSTVHRIVMALEHHRVIYKNPETGRYRLGLKLFELGSAAITAVSAQETPPGEEVGTSSRTGTTPAPQARNG